MPGGGLGGEEPDLRRPRTTAATIAATITSRIAPSSAYPSVAGRPRNFGEEDDDELVGEKTTVMVTDWAVTLAWPDAGVPVYPDTAATVNA